MVRRSVLLILVLLVLSVLFTPGKASAQAGLAGELVSVCVAPVRPGDKAAAMFDADGRFDCRSRQTDLGPGDYWVRSQRIGRVSTPGEELRIRSGSLYQGPMSLYARYADGTTALLHRRDEALGRRLQLGAIVEHRIPAHAAPLDRLLWKVERSANLRGILVGPRVATAEESISANLRMTAIYAGFSGLAFALLVYNLALWAALRYRFQLAYCAMVALLIAYAVSSSGALAWAAPDLPNNLRIRLNHLLLASAAAAALLFARSFFEPRVFAGWLGRATDALVLALLGAGAGFFLLAPFAGTLVDRAYSIVFSLLVLAFVPVVWRAWKMRSNYLWVFAIAWAVPVAAAGLRLLGNLGFFEWRFWVDNSTLLAMAAEAMMSSLAIAYRVRLLSRERDQAIAQESVARQLAETDPLTGLLNRRAFLARAIGRSAPQTLLLIDIDHFKQVNETLGHDGGDEVLRIYARALRALSPAGALVARLGGEEFAILCNSTDAPDPETVLERLRSTRMPFDLIVTASIGCCEGPLATEPQWKALYRAADGALFEAKAAGRDRWRPAGRLAAAA